jgi:hypothetical protein
MRTLSSRRRNAAAARTMIVVAIAVGAYFGVAAIASGSPQSVSGEASLEASQVSSVKTAFTASIRLQQSLGSPPASYMTNALSAVRAHKMASVVGAATRQQLQASSQHAISQDFSSAQAEIERADLNDALTRLDNNPNIVNLGSGVTAIKFLNIAVAGLRATVEAQVTCWAKSEVRQSAHGPWLLAAPVNVVDFTATLALNAHGAWHVTSVTGSFVPGEGP